MYRPSLGVWKVFSITRFAGAWETKTLSQPVGFRTRKSLTRSKVRLPHTSIVNIDTLHFTKGIPSVSSFRINPFTLPRRIHKVTMTLENGAASLSSDVLYWAQAAYEIYLVECVADKLLTLVNLNGEATNLGSNVFPECQRVHKNQVGQCSMPNSR
jgi:hypothetical protein